MLKILRCNIIARYRFDRVWRICVAFIILSTFNFCIFSAVYALERSGALSLRKFQLLDRFSAMEQSSEINFYLNGILDGLSFANASLESSGKSRLFCTDSLPTIDDLRNVLRDRIRLLEKIGSNTEQALERTGVVAIIIQDLRLKFPCR